MRMKQRWPMAALALAIALLAVPPAWTEDEPVPKGIAALAWLAGNWVGGDDAQGMEALYTTPRGGEILSATKMISKGRCVFFEWERFFERDGKVILNPYPGGKQSVEFVLGGFDPKVKKARFSNETHDFPQHLTYECPDAMTLRITLEGVERGKPKTMVLPLRRR